MDATATPDDHQVPPTRPEHTPTPEADGQNAPKATDDAGMSHEDALAALAATRKEAAKYRNERNELRGAAQKWNEYEEAQKSELQRAQEAAAQAQADLEKERAHNTILTLASTYGIHPEDFGLLGEGTPEQIEERAQRIKALYEAQAPAGGTPPPSQRPHEALNPGASDRQPPADDTYPTAWTPKGLRTPTSQ